MVDKAVVVEETVTVEESLRFITPPPEIYTDTRDEIVALRSKIMQDLVAGRVKALLDAGHDSMNKYRGKIDKLGITTYLFGDLRRKAMVIRLKGYDLGEGLFRYAKTQFDAPLADYPLLPPYNVPQRKLPQVDVFFFPEMQDIDIKEMSAGATLQGMITIQTKSGEFLETPDAENALYDYFFVYPQYQRSAKFTPSDASHGVVSWTGSGTVLSRDLHRTSDGFIVGFFVEVFFDAIVDMSVGDDTPTLVIARFSPTQTMPATTIILSQYRIHSDNQGVYMTMAGIIPSLGWYQVGTGLSTIEDAKTTWSNHFKVTISVNNPDWGYTTPSAGEYTYEADYLLSVGATPYGGYAFDHWELDGVNVSSSSPFIFNVRKPCELKAFFKMST